MTPDDCGYLAPLIDRTGGRLDIAVAAYRAAPTQANHQAVMDRLVEHDAAAAAFRVEELVAA